MLGHQRLKAGCMK